MLSDTPIFLGNGDASCGGLQLIVAQQDTKLTVKRIRYWKDCATVDVALPDGQTGHLVFDPRKVKLAPPLE